MPGDIVEKWVDIGGIRTRYLQAGQGSTTLLFLHGLGSSADRWLDIPLALSLYHRAVAVDLPGFGMSDKNSPSMQYTTNDYVEFIVRMLHELKEDGKIAIVGHSLGGYIAAEIAIRYKPLVDQLVLIDSSGMLDGPTYLLEEYLKAAMNPTKESVRKVFEQLVANPARIPDALVDGFIYRMGLPGAKNSFKLAYQNSVNTQIGKHRLEQLSDTKTLIIWGKQDKLIPFEYCKKFQTAITRSKVELIEDAGHAPFAEKPALICEIVHQFLG